MLELLFVWLMVALAVEAITEIIVDSKFFLGFRNWLAKKCTFLGELFSCGYCLSVWVAMLVACQLPGVFIGIPILNVVLKIFILHRLSNVVHNVIKVLTNNTLFSFSLSTGNDEPTPK